MNTDMRTSRLIGALLLAQLAAGPVVNLVLMGPVFSGPGGFLVNAAPHALDIGLAVILGLVTGAISVGMAIAAWPVFRRYSPALALWLLVLGAVCLALTAVESVAVMSLLSLSQASCAA